MLLLQVPETLLAVENSCFLSEVMRRSCYYKYQNIYLWVNAHDFLKSWHNFSLMSGIYRHDWLTFKLFTMEINLSLAIFYGKKNGYLILDKVRQEP